jgi:hypothetical protein
MKKKIYQKIYFIYVMVIQHNVLRMILGQDIPIVYPNLEWTQSRST